MGLRRFIIVTTASLLGMLTLAVWFYPSNDDFRIENPFWNGYEALAENFPVRPLSSLANLPSPAGEVTVMEIPSVAFTAGEVGRLKGFVEGGGKLVLADDYGHGNQVLESFGLAVRFTGQVMLDPVINYKNGQFPRIIHFRSGPLTDNITEIVFNHATSLEGVTGEEALAYSSSFSFLDTNDDGESQDDEPRGPLPVISVHPMGSGQVVLIADASLFLNSMMFEDNTKLLRNIVAGQEAIYIDQSHLPSSELVRTKGWIRRASDFLSSPAGTTAAVGIVLAAALAPLWRKDKETRSIE